MHKGFIKHSFKISFSERLIVHLYTQYRRNKYRRAARDADERAQPKKVSARILKYRTENFWKWESQLLHWKMVTLTQKMDTFRCQKMVIFNQMKADFKADFRQCCVDQWLIQKGSGGSLESPSPPSFLNILWEWNKLVSVRSISFSWDI